MTADSLAARSDSPATAGLSAGTARADLSAILDEVQHKAFRIALYRLGDREAALDVVQDSMLRLMERYPDKPRTELVPLFYTILNNRITDVHRWNRLRRGGYRLLAALGVGGGERDDGAGGPAHDPPARGDHEPDSELLGSELRHHIDEALGRLSPRQRTVFLLREWQGLSVNETAAALGCSAGSVKQHHFRALRALRRELEPVWDEGSHAGQA